jgi:CRISPR-associated protein Cas2
MLLISYDISDNKVRTKFSKFLEKHGRRMQYSVFAIKNSKRVLNLILNEIEVVFMKKFQISDSILIFPISEKDEQKTIKYGYAAHEDEDVVVF